MQTVLIAPGIRSGTSWLGLQFPLAALPILGCSLLEYWLSELASTGTTEVVVSAADRPEILAPILGTGARWGVEAFLIAESTEPTLTEASARYAEQLNRSSLLYPVVLMDHLPGRDQKLFEDYTSWFAALSDWLPQAITPDRVGIRQVRPGIYVSVNSRVSRHAELRSPCWIGEGVFVGARCIVGPYAFLENHSYLEADVEVSHSQVGPGTFIGRYTVLQQCLAWANTLVNWQSGTATTISDPFVMGKFGKAASKPLALP
jgi:NDP-sugar pyrophosphorylase family protein